MLHNEILQKWIGKNYIEPWMKTAECVAWAKKYCQERGYPIKWFGGSAWKWWQTWSPFDNTWKRVIKTSLNAPSEGDVVFFDERRCLNGHISIAGRFCNPLVLRHVDQNWTGKQDKIQARFSTYANCVGWFHKI